MEYNFYSLFSIPVLEASIEVSAEIIDYIHSLEYKRTDFNNADISIFQNILDHPIFGDYSDKIDSLVSEFVFEISKFDQSKLFLDRVASWSNRHHYSDWAQDHSHVNSFVSGVWYLETPENCGDLNLQSPHIGFGLPLDYPRVEYNDYNSHSCTLKAMKNKIYIFPSTLRHSVFRNESEHVRTSIAFNYYARGILETEDNLIHS